MAASKAVYRTYIPNIWRWDHDCKRNRNESDTHALLKVTGAEFLDRCGHDFSRVENIFYDGTSKFDREWVYNPTQFEVGYDAGIADVACECSDCNTYVEVGHVSAKKWYKASQYPNTDSLVIIPYTRVSDLGDRGEERNVYLFHRVEEPTTSKPIHPSAL